ncbi:DUF7529 family protein [Haloferacaceae archaeon DSL9]
MRTSQHPLTGREGAWDELVDAMGDRAAADRDDGWETLELHTGDVTPLPGPRSDRSLVGFNVLVPGDEFAALEARIEDATIDEYEVYRRQVGNLVLLLLVVRDAAAEFAAYVPLYYGVEAGMGLIEAAEEAGELGTYVRPLSNDRHVAFSHDDPTLFFPDELPDELREE